MFAVLPLMPGCSPSTPKATPAAPAVSTPAPPPLAEVAELIRAGQLKEAEQRLQETLIKDPQNLQAEILMVDALVGQNRFEDAAEWAMQMATNHPDQRDPLQAQSAELWNSAGRPGKAMQIYGEVLDQNPTFLLARRKLIETFRGQGFVFDANRQARILAAQTPLLIEELVGMIQPTFPSATFAEKPDVEDAELRRRVGQLNIAAALQSRGDVREAIQVLESVDWEGERKAAVLSVKAWLLARTQRWKELKELLGTLHDSAEDYPTYWMAMGGLALHQRHPAADACYLEAIAREPNFPEAYDGLIQARKQSGDVADLEQIEARRKQVADTRFFVNHIGAGHDTDGRMIQALGKLLNEMGRPMESLAWQELVIAAAAPGSPQLQTLQAYKQQVAGRYPGGMDPSVVRLGNKATPEAIHEFIASIDVGTDNDAPNRQAFPPAAVPVFVDVAAEIGVDVQYLNATRQLTRQFQIHQSLGTGVACLDFDLDGGVDFYFGQGGFEPPEGQSTLTNQLFRQAGDRFVAVTNPSRTEDYGYTHGVTSGDWNQDGFPDLVVGNLGVNQLLINQGDGTFRSADVQRDADWLDGKFTTAIGMADVTGDSLPDLVEINYLDDPTIFSPSAVQGTTGKTLQVGPLYYQSAVDRIFRSAGDGSWVAEGLGPGEGMPSTGLGVIITDLDEAAGNEIFVANDQLANHFWKRSGDTFVESAVAAGIAYATDGKPLACMGVAPADHDGNGTTDLHITNYLDEWSNLYLQTQPGVYEDRAAQYRLDVPTNPMVGFGTQAIDYDNNTSFDLAIGNGHTENFSDSGIAFRMPTQILSRTSDGFDQADVQGDPDYWTEPHVGRSLARCDFNRDGRVDFVLTDLLEKSSVFRNDCETDNHFLQVETIGIGSERDAIGTRVVVHRKSSAITQMTQSGDGYLSKNESALFFGLADQSSVVSISVRWPDGAVQSFENVEVDSRVLLVQGDDRHWYRWKRGQ